MSIDKKEVQRIARLAKLKIDDDSVESMSQELSKILAYVEKLQQLDTDDIEPTTQVTVDVAPLRPDERLEGVEKSEALKQAPRADEVGFLVPGFVDES